MLGAATGLVFEIPTGVVADTVGRKASILIAHATMGASMLATGLVTSFPALALTQMLWALSWTFSSGADVAWLTDELDVPARAARVLATSARGQQLGAAIGLIGFGVLAFATELATAIVASGVAMWALGAWVALRFGEHKFTPTRSRRWRASAAIFRRGIALARGDREILLVFAVTALVNGAAEGFGRLLAKRLVELGLPGEPTPILWLTGLGLGALALGALSLRGVETWIDRERAAPRLYAGACLAGALGTLALSRTHDVAIGMAGALVVQGIGLTVSRCVGEIWVNRRTSSDVRATVHSFLGQAEHLGEIGFGLGLGVLAQTAGIAAALLGSAALLAAAAALVASRGRDRVLR